MEPNRKRRHPPLYPVFAAAALLGSSCGLEQGEQPSGGAGTPNGTAQELQPLPKDQWLLQKSPQRQAPQPQPPEYAGGGAPYEAFHVDGGSQ